MTRPGGEETSARRFRITWLILLALLLAAFAGTVTVLNSTLYSASGFVASYLDALARHDVAEALSTPGVTPAATGSKELLPPYTTLFRSAARARRADEAGGHPPRRRHRE